MILILLRKSNLQLTTDDLLNIVGFWNLFQNHATIVGPAKASVLDVFCKVWAALDSEAVCESRKQTSDRLNPPLKNKNTILSKVISKTMK